MKKTVVVLAIMLVCAAGFSQRPSDPALLVPHNAPALNYVPVANPFSLPAGVTIGPTASVTFDSRGHLFVLTRGMQPIMEFDENGKHLRSFGLGLFTRTHGIRVDGSGNIWVTDVGAHIVMKLNPQGEIVQTLGTKGQAGEWNESTQSRLFNEPTDIAFGRNGELFIVQGHNPAAGDPRVLKFDQNGKFIKSWGGKGKAPGQFAVAHGIGLDAKNLLWVADRENQRVQVFDTDGKFVREMKYGGLPCALDIGKENVYMVNGFAGQILQLDLEGKVLAVTGKPGTGLGEFGEAHFIAVSPKGELFVADVTSGVHKFVRK
jgi:DNA-binding beta-propeller fold protein YncE